jgi:hypothetical protein
VVAGRVLLGHCGLWGWPERVAGVAQVAVIDVELSLNSCLALVAGVAGQQSVALGVDVNAVSEFRH